MKVELGDKVRDRISGFTGIVTMRSDYLNGCSRVAIEPQELHDGKPIEAHYFDEMQLEVIEKNALKEGPHETGGPRSRKVPPLTGHR